MTLSPPTAPAETGTLGEADAFQALLQRLAQADAAELIDLARTCPATGMRPAARQLSAAIERLRTRLVKVVATELATEHRRVRTEQDTTGPAPGTAGITAETPTNADTTSVAASVGVDAAAEAEPQVEPAPEAAPPSAARPASRERGGPGRPAGAQGPARRCRLEGRGERAAGVPPRTAHTGGGGRRTAAVRALRPRPAGLERPHADARGGLTHVPH
ncbi:hypothetical protein ACFQ0B_81315 [Nonomuraea thailandensis]